ncbi:MAG: hypothetical protein A4E62_02566 [Syntrophorhabdus sp. PtaU1.Bin002]|nr:MAG: hypothetical protein A4E62_02566 [Syntrophorhabdus sp. PtaU1.Bin002]
MIINSSIPMEFGTILPIDAISSLQELYDESQNNPYHLNGHKAGGVRTDAPLATRLDGVLWDLGMMTAIIEDANNSNKRFRCFAFRRVYSAGNRRIPRRIQGRWPTEGAGDA